MNVLGIDFTSRPCRQKPICCVDAELKGNELIVNVVHRWSDFAAFEAALARPGPWIAGMDFPFGQSRRFIRNIGWPRGWADYVAHVGTMSRADFRRHLDAYRKHRQPGDKEHRRQTDMKAGAISPQKLYGVPVGLMFFEGAPRLLQSGASVPGLRDADPERIAVEAYPGALVRILVGRRSYKNDTVSKQTSDQREARNDIVKALRDGALLATHGCRVHADEEIADDPAADDLDALLCAVQAAAAWIRRDAGFGAPPDVDANEGWIAEPTIYASG